ncbi:hypothetical protein BBJ28_00017738 [Nothophytophthora sp. Chile5]|nr:hypothetical protein BBJ28_00017738 [Nothophytophthora sp. Chile5]
MKWATSTGHRTRIWEHEQTQIRVLMHAVALRSLRPKGAATAVTRALSSSTSPASALKVLIIDGYSPDGRADLEAGGASTAGKLYIDLLAKSAPTGVEVASDVVYPADSDFTAPDLSKVVIAWLFWSIATNVTNWRPHLACARESDGHIGVCTCIPQYGSCWAAQIAVAAAGGYCGGNPRGREMGLARKIALSPEGRAHPMFEGKPSVFDAFTSHNDEITHLPPGGLSLCGNDFTSVQAVAVRHKKGDFWAVQYHPEYDLHELARLTYCRRAKLVGLGFFADMKSADEYVDDLENLHIDPSRYDIAWRLGLDADVMDENIRHCETRNFLKYLALPYKAVVEGNK